MNLAYEISRALAYEDLNPALGAAEGGVISKEIERIFQRVGEVIDENQKKNRAQNATLRNSSLDRKRG